MQHFHTLRTRKKRAKASVFRLKESYGSPFLNNKSDPLDELVFILLSQMTASISYERVYDRVKSEIPNWEQLTEIPLVKLENLITDAGLFRHRATRLKQIAKRLTTDFGKVSLDSLFDYDDEQAQEYLMSLPGIGVKSAKCVLMYSLGRQVLPVDTHTARIAYRLGLVSSNEPLVVDKEISVVVPRELCFDFHVNAVAHGRAICDSRKPRCDSCVLFSLCQSEHKTNSQR
ncbi:MAG: hypothetical protein OXH31_00770 [Gammaproteobacteria bacterium]|nr:hypothetical protein [Gammaproteobacteria bacterium]